jgi:hypothetical protein
MPSSLQVAVEGLVEPVLGDVALRRRDALLDLELLVAEGHRRVRQPHVVEAGRLGDQRARGKARRHVVARLEGAAHVAGADAQLHHGRHVAGLAEREGVLDQVDHRCRSGRGSNSASVLFIAKAWVRSWITLAPSP